MSWNFLEYKGRIATVMGFFLAGFVNAKFIWDYYNEVAYSQNLLIMTIAMNVVSMIWFILPSWIKITGGKFTLEIKD